MRTLHLVIKHYEDTAGELITTMEYNDDGYAGQANHYALEENRWRSSQNNIGIGWEAGKSMTTGDYNRYWFCTFANEGGVNQSLARGKSDNMVVIGNSSMWTYDIVHADCKWNYGCKSTFPAADGTAQMELG